jgi:hypothetical protein
MTVFSTRGKQFLIVVCILILAESGSYFFLKREKKEFSPFVQMDLFSKPSVQELQTYGFDEIDPLLGWGMSTVHFNKLGFEVFNSMPVLKSRNKTCSKKLKVLITGGSTSDIALHIENWPAQLIPLLEKQGICAELYIGAVGGYSSGQELLKLLCDGQGISPDIHISYSGANETIHPFFVSTHEQNLFERMMKTETSAIFPNTLYVTRSIFFPSPKVFLRQPRQINPQWATNMETMHAIANEKGYSFIGVLQPVLGIGKVVQPQQEEQWKSMIDSYKKFYPDAILSVKDKPYLVNMTNLFDSTQGPVYTDDCHLLPGMQPLVANRMLNLIMEQINNAKQN